jgi:hypothetical protein
MEAAFQTDFSDVRIHEGAHAAELGALAFTRGRDIHFAPGQYQPHTPAGQELLGHELAHVVQQSQGRVAGVQTKNGAINAAPALEREADELGRRAAGYSGPPAAELAFLDAPTHTPVQLQADPHQRITTFDGRISVYDKKNGDKQFKLKKGTRVNA